MICTSKSWETAKQLWQQALKIKDYNRWFLVSFQQPLQTSVLQMQTDTHWVKKSSVFSEISRFTALARVTLDCMLRLINPVDILTACFLKIQPNIILSFTLKSQFIVSLEVLRSNFCMHFSCQPSSASLNNTRAVQKVSDVIFFPRKLMKHRRCAVAGRWRGPSCIYVDLFPPADSLSRVQRACEWECICSELRIVIFCQNDRTTRAAVLHQILPEAWR